jgi:hypothetical protein
MKLFVGIGLTIALGAVLLGASGAFAFAGPQWRVGSAIALGLVAVGAVIYLGAISGKAKGPLGRDWSKAITWGIVALGTVTAVWNIQILTRNGDWKTWLLVASLSAGLVVPMLGVTLWIRSAKKGSKEMTLPRHDGAACFRLMQRITIMWAGSLLTGRLKKPWRCGGGRQTMHREFLCGSRNRTSGHDGWDTFAKKSVIAFYNITQS